MSLIKFGLLALFYTLGVSVAQAQAWPKTQTFGNDTLSIVTTADCNSRHKGSVKAVLDVQALPSPVAPIQKVVLYRQTADGSFRHLYSDTVLGYTYERGNLLARDFKLRWYYDGNCYVEVPFTIFDTPLIEAELHVEQSTEEASCQDGRAYLEINRPSDVNYWTSWSNGDNEITLTGLEYNSSDLYFGAGNWNVRLYSSDGCDAYTTPSRIDGSPVYNAIAEFDFTIDCCIKNSTPPNIRYVTHPDNCDSSNGGFSVFGGAPPASNLAIDAFEWIVTDVHGNWVPPTNGDSGPNYDGLPAGDYTFEAITDEMYDDDVFEGCDMPTKTFRLGEDCE